MSLKSVDFVLRLSCVNTRLAVEILRASSQQHVSCLNFFTNDDFWLTFSSRQQIQLLLIAVTTRPIDLFRVV